ncbi:hypothetical protein D3C72_407820 [compost metagenome]
MKGTATFSLNDWMPSPTASAVLLALLTSWLASPTVTSTSFASSSMRLRLRCTSVSVSSTWGIMVCRTCLSVTASCHMAYAMPPPANSTAIVAAT